MAKHLGRVAVDWLEYPDHAESNRSDKTHRILEVIFEYASGMPPKSPCSVCSEGLEPPIILCAIPMEEQEDKSSRGGGGLLLQGPFDQQGHRNSWNNGSDHPVVRSCTGRPMMKDGWLGSTLQEVKHQSPCRVVGSSHQYPNDGTFS